VHISAFLGGYQDDEGRFGDFTHSSREGRKCEPGCSTDDALMNHQHIHRITYTMARVMGSNKYRPVSSRLVDEEDMGFEATRPNDTGHGRVCPSSFRWRVTHKFGSVSFSTWQLHGSGSTRGGRGERRGERGGGGRRGIVHCMPIACPLHVRV